MSARREERRAAWAFVAPALAVIFLIAIFPLFWTMKESLYRHDLRMPWLGEPFVGLENFARVFQDPRFSAALLHTLFFTLVSVGLEMVLGLFIALAVNRSFRGRGLLRASFLLPWAMPTVVAALVWRFLFASDSGLVNTLLVGSGIVAEPVVWLAGRWTAWVPLILADVWKTTPFVALLLLAGLQNIPGELYEAASMDGASARAQFLHVTLPMLKPALLVALIFRTLDAFRVFDLVYVLTGGGPGTATEPLALYTFNTLFQDLRFGTGAALSVIVFLVTFVLSMIYIRLLGGDLLRGER